MNKNYLEVFDSKNTSIERPLHHATTPQEIRSWAIKEAHNAYKVVAYRIKGANLSFNEYQKNSLGKIELTSWSYPNGITS